MTLFQDLYWGIELIYSQPWQYRYHEGAVWFEPRGETPEGEDQVPSRGHLIIRADWTYPNDDIDKLWSQHVMALAGGMGAKNVGSAPLIIRNAKGYEAEIILPKKENTRLWLGILKNGPIVLNMVVAHHIKEREWMEPEVSKMIASLNFFQKAEGLSINDHGLPIPPDYLPYDPLLIVSDIPDATNWQAYSGNASIGALQAFYMREASNFGWSITGYIPFPSNQSDLGFSRFELAKGEQACTVGIMPYGSEMLTSASPSRIVIKWG